MARVLLAALLLDAGRVVPVSTLKDTLWGGAPPASAHASLHNHVARLRRMLDHPGRLRAVPPGYLLQVAQGELDVHVFEAHVAAARAAHAGREWERTVRECVRALALWRGAPLSGLPAEVGGYAFVQRLVEARLLVLEWRYDAELALAAEGASGWDRLAGLVPELAELAAEYPLREAYHRQLMLALHRTGRRAEALAVHRDLRLRLVEELGVEPGEGVRGAHVEVLRGPSAERGGAGRNDSGGAAVSGAGAARAEAARPVSRGPEAAGPVSCGPEACGPVSCGPEAARPVSCGPEAADPAPCGPEAAGPAPCGLETGGRESCGPEAARPVSCGPEAAGPAPCGLETGGRESCGPEACGPVSCGLEAARPVSCGPEAAGPAPCGPEACGPAPCRPEASRPESGRPAPGGLRPSQLPPPPAHFSGRSAVRGTLLRTLTRPAALAVVTGMAGVGKSALALHAAHTLAERFSDGQLYVNLRGATPGMTPLGSGQALTALLRDLGVEPRRIPEHPDAATALLRSLLAPTRTLLVLDDAASAAQVRPLLPAGAGCAVIVTSRSPLTALDGARRFPLTPLSGPESAALLRAVSGRDGLDAAHPLVELTGRLPLALRVVAARLAARRALTPDVLADQLSATEGRLHHLEYDDLSVRRSLAVAHDALAASDREADRDAALALRRLGALDLPSYGAPLIARLTGTGERRAEAALDRLVDVALLEETAYARYAPHDLVRDFARELASAGPRHGGAGRGGDAGKGSAHRLVDREEREGPDDVQDWVDHALRWYAATAERTLTAIVEPGLDQDDRRRPTAAQPPGHAVYVATVAPFEGAEAAFAWAGGELCNIVALVKAHADGACERRTAYLSTLLRLLAPCLHRSGRIPEMELLGRAALKLARRLGDAAAEATALVDLAGMHFLTGRQNEALALNDEALAIWRRLGAVSWIRRCLNNRGLLLEGLGQYAESEDALRQSLGYSRRLNDPYGEAVTYSHLGNLHEHTDPRAAIEHHRRSLALGVGIGAVIVQHSAHCNIGYAHLTLGEPAAAAGHFEESLRILGGHGDWHGESRTRLGLIRALHRLGSTARAERECAELLRRAEARSDRYTGGLGRHQHGLLLRDQGREDEAREAWRTALADLDGTDERAVVTELRSLLSGAA
ncbi:BTAD domain-containing putative transcriptional regulator [Streptomyces sp. NPDC052023]|uniref:BTAD domain-containing putative transcriptional regulator n=1 Tax=Streptomyces sp. NPDC052023 TaxID=3365681 RepID=UPI0037D64DB3